MPSPMGCAEGLAKELIALNQDPLGFQAYVVQHEYGGYVLVKDIEQKRGKVRAVALYNPTDAACSFDVPAELLELGGTLRVRDLVKQQDEGSVEGGLSYQLLPPHSVKILRVEGERRLEPLRYEAEWAYLHGYSDLAKPRSVVYTPCKEASGGMVVSNLGGEAENYAEWKEVYSEKGGNYRMHISYLPATGKGREIKDRKLEVEVNSKKTLLTDLESDPAKGISTVTLSVKLKPGYNVVRMCSPYTWTPDVDCFRLEKEL